MNRGSNSEIRDYGRLRLRARSFKQSSESEAPDTGDDSICRWLRDDRQRASKHGRKHVGIALPCVSERRTRNVYRVGKAPRSETGSIKGDRCELRRAIWKAHRTGLCNYISLP